MEVKVTQNTKWMVTKKKQKSGKKRGWKKKKKKWHDGPWVESTLDPSKKALRAAL